MVVFSNPIYEWFRQHVSLSWCSSNRWVSVIEMARTEANDSSRYFTRGHGCSCSDKWIDNYSQNAACASSWNDQLSRLISAGISGLMFTVCDVLRVSTIT